MRLSRLLACCVLGCGSSTPDVFNIDTDSGGPQFKNDGGDPKFGEGGTDGNGGPPGCTEAAKLVYLVTEQGDLWSFDPGTIALAKIGKLDCPTGSLVTPNSMAVDRDAKAYVNMSDGSIFTANTTNAHCSATSYEDGQTGRRVRGMGVSSDTAGGTAETLFTCTSDSAAVMTGSGLGLAKVDVNSYALTPLGDYTNGIAGAECELTGTGDARLFGFFALLTPPKLSQIDKTSAATTSPVPLGGVSTSSAYAFTFWGGDFWFYTAAQGGNSKITRYRYSTNKSFSVVKADTGMTIVGAGVSTCAPTIAPN